MEHRYWDYVMLTLAAGLGFACTPGGHPNSPICGHLKFPHLNEPRRT